VVKIAKQAKKIYTERSEVSDANRFMTRSIDFLEREEKRDNTDQERSERPAFVVETPNNTQTEDSGDGDDVP